MYKILTILLLLLTFNTKAQVGEVKVTSTQANIYNEKGSYVTSISLGSNKSLIGYNSKFIVIKEGQCAKIYNDRGSYTGYSISLGTSKTIKNVSPTNILVKEGHSVKYYDFNGSYTGHSTND